MPPDTLPFFSRLGTWLVAMALLLTLPGFSSSAAASSELAVVPPVTSCAALSGVDLTKIGGEGSTITSTTETTSDGIPVCSVEGTLAPAIDFQVLLPTETWSQRYLQVGCGGLCGQITLRSGASEGCQTLNGGGFVMAATNMGHDGDMSGDGSWGRDAQKRQDFAYRAQHLTAEAAKALIAAFYGQPQRYAYFNGCSDGGREALMEAQRFPDDFDGVIAGAPAMLFQVQNTLYHGWQARANTDDDGHIILRTEQLPILHEAVLDACDARDGVEDGLIAAPAACDFDPTTLVCRDDTNDPDGCLTRAQAEAAKRLYEGPVDPGTGAHLTAGQPLYGSELNWQGVFVADSADGQIMSPQAALPVIRYLAFPEARPNATLADLPFNEATLDALRQRHPLFDATNADLSGFQRSDGKLIMWHGLADPHISPANTVAYHQALIDTMGEDTVQGFERLYLLPGVSHCGNGQGPSHLDLLTPMMAWVEDGVAPKGVMTRSTGEASTFGAPDFSGSQASSAEGHDGPPPGMVPTSTLPDMTRPVYPYPSVARYSGEGDIHDGKNWERGNAARVVDTRHWPGEDLFGPYTFSDQ